MITFNGVTSDSLGLIVERFPARPLTTRKQYIYKIPARNGDLIIDENAFENYDQAYDVYVKPNFPANMKAIAKWLLGPNGYAQLIDSYDNEQTYRNARFVGGVQVLNALNKYGKATITFNCCPQRYLITDETVSGTFGDTLTIPTHADMMPGYPLITITGWESNDAGKIETDDITITIPAQSTNIGNIMIDFEMHTVKGMAVPLSAVTVVGKWTTLDDGDTIVTTLTNGTAHPVSVNPRRWYL